MLNLVQHFFQNPSLSSNPGRPSQNLFSQRRLTEESRCPSDYLEMLEGVLYCLFLFRRAILEHTQSVILTSLDFAILIGINSDADGMLRSRILVNQQNNRLDMARYLNNDVTIVPVLGNKSTLFSVRGNISTPCPFLRFTHIICAFCYPYQSLNRRSKRKQVYKLISRLPYIMQAILVSTLVTVSTFLQFWETFHQWQMCAF